MPLDHRRRVCLAIVAGLLASGPAGGQGGSVPAAAAGSATAATPGAPPASPPASPPGTPPALPPAAIVFEDVRVFDGLAGSLSGPASVLVVGNRIEAIAPATAGANTPGALAPPAGSAVTRIAGGGRTLMPGMIDAHTHLMFANLPQVALLTADIGYVQIAAGKGATEMLLRGFTSARDLGGPVFGLKRAIDTGLIPGPRIWPAGSFVSQSGGHGDFRLPTEVPARPGDYSYSERVGAAAIADDPDTVRKRVREQLQLGASQVKLMAGGGISSNFDPLDVTQYSVPELRAAVEAAENWGTYVTVHAYTPRAVRQAIEAGVKCIDHGQLLDEDTAKLMAKAGVFWSLQPFIDDGISPFPEGSPNRIKQKQMQSGTDRAYRLAKKYGIRTAFGVDALFDPAAAARQGEWVVRLLRWYSPAEALRMVTSGNAELLALSGPRNPYPGPLGVVAPGALADLLLVDGDPLADLGLLADPERNLVVIVKDGRIYKNSLSMPR